MWNANEFVRSKVTLTCGVRESELQLLWVVVVVV